MSPTLHMVIKDAPVIPGRSRGREIGTPTLNVDLQVVPKELAHGIYACRITFGGQTYAGAMHFGPRPVFHDTDTLEVHVLDATLERPPETVDLEIVRRIRDIRDFESVEALKQAIAEDIEATRGIIGTL